MAGRREQILKGNRCALFYAGTVYRIGGFCYDRNIVTEESTIPTKIMEPDQPPVGYFLAGTPGQSPMALTEIHGDKRCVFGDRRSNDFINDPLGYSKLQVFGFALSK